MKPWLALPSTSLLAFATFALVGCQQLENDLGAGSSTEDATTNTNGSVCVGAGNGADGIDCCVDNGGDCSTTGDYACCTGLCSGGTCVASANVGCIAALGSRCPSVATCACGTSDDCCQEATGAICGASTVTTVGKRCCLDTGIPCGSDGDCCSKSCDATQSTCD